MDLFIRRLQKCDVFSELLSDLNNHSKLSQLAYCVQNCVEPPLCVVQIPECLKPKPQANAALIPNATSQAFTSSCHWQKEINAYFASRGNAFRLPRKFTTSKTFKVLKYIHHAN